MISYSNYKLLKEADAPAASPPAGGAPDLGATAGGGTPPGMDLGAAGAAVGGPPPGFSGGPPMGGIGGGGPPPDLGMGGPPGTGSAAGLKPQGLKSSNVWDVLEEILNKSSKNKHK